jgi:hypothetical protein
VKGYLEGDNGKNLLGLINNATSFIQQSNNVSEALDIREENVLTKIRSLGKGGWKSYQAKCQAAMLQVISNNNLRELEANYERILDDMVSKDDVSEAEKNDS